MKTTRITISKEHQKRRDDLQHDVDRFLANGGVIQQCPYGASGEDSTANRRPTIRKEKRSDVSLTH